MRLRVFAPAKINLYLHVGPLRDDGLHPLESVAVFADVGDAVTIEAADLLQVEVEGPFAQALAHAGGESLIARAAALVHPGAGPRGARIVLDKRLPIASGIGGGSADAAAALRGLCALWGVADADLPMRARALGADVPVCVGCAPAFMAGAGERVQPIAAPELHAVLANPGAPAPTGAVYRAFDALCGGAEFQEQGPPDLGDPIAALMARRNDLTNAAITVAPAIARVLERLSALPQAQIARLSGSGATCFALFPDRRAAQAAAQRLAALEPNWWVRAARLGAIDARPQPL